MPSEIAIGPGIWVFTPHTLSAAKPDVALKHNSRLFRQQFPCPSLFIFIGRTCARTSFDDMVAGILTLRLAPFQCVSTRVPAEPTRCEIEARRAIPLLSQLEEFRGNRPRLRTLRTGVTRGVGSFSKDRVASGSKLSRLLHCLPRMNETEPPGDLLPSTGRSCRLLDRVSTAKIEFAKPVVNEATGNMARLELRGDLIVPPEEQIGGTQLGGMSTQELNEQATVLRGEFYRFRLRRFSELLLEVLTTNGIGRPIGKVRSKLGRPQARLFVESPELRLVLITPSSSFLPSRIGFHREAPFRKHIKVHDSPGESKHFTHFCR